MPAVRGRTRHDGKQVPQSMLDGCPLTGLSKDSFDDCSHMLKE